jgi:hypothetical protein
MPAHFFSGLVDAPAPPGDLPGTGRPAAAAAARSLLEGPSLPIGLLDPEELEPDEPELPLEDPLDPDDESLESLESLDEEDESLLELLSLESEDDELLSLESLELEDEPEEPLDPPLESELPLEDESLEPEELEPDEPELEPPDEGKGMGSSGAFAMRLPIPTSGETRTQGYPYRRKISLAQATLSDTR